MTAIVDSGLYELLKGLAGGRVFFLVAKQNETTPFIIIQTVSSDRWRDINDPSGMAQATVQIDCYADTFMDAKQLSGQIEAILDGYRGTVSYGATSPQSTVRIAGASLQNEFDTLDQTAAPRLFRNLSTYLVTYQQ
jgi:hypothetical protein